MSLAYSIDFDIEEEHPTFNDRIFYDAVESLAMLGPESGDPIISDNDYNVENDNYEGVGRSVEKIFAKRVHQRKSIWNIETEHGLYMIYKIVYFENLLGNRFVKIEIRNVKNDFNVIYDLIRCRYSKYKKCGVGLPDRYGATELKNIDNVPELGKVLVDIVSRFKPVCKVI